MSVNSVNSVDSVDSVDATKSINMYLDGNYAPVADEVTAFDLPIVGSLPAELNGRYLRNGDVAYIQFWDPAVAGYAMNVMAVMALAKKPIAAGADLGLAGYTKLEAPDAARPNMLVGQGWVGVTKENMGQYNF